MFEKSSQRTQEVIFFIGDSGVTKEMMYTEFEAVLDGVVALDEFSNARTYCVFTVISPGLRPEAFVFFTIDFDHEGYPPDLWNVPFLNLIQKSSKVNIGPYHAKVVTRSACAIEWHRDGLWDPSDEVVERVVHAIGENHLCLSTEGAQQDMQASTPVPGFMSQPVAQFGAPVAPGMQVPAGMSPGQSLPELVQEMAQKLSGVTAAQQNTSNSGLDEELRQTLKTLSHDLHTTTQKATELERQNGLLRAKVSELKKDRSGEMKKLSKEYEAKIRNSVTEAKATLKEKYEKKLRSYEQEFKARFSSRVSEIKTSASATNQALSEKSELLTEKDALLIEKREKLESQQQVIREKEQLIQSQSEQLKAQVTEHESLEATVKKLSEELASFRKEKLRLMSEGADKFFERLEESGLNFIAYHPGAGHVSVSVSQVATYLENPQAFAAEKVGLSEEAYAYWLAHYEKPCCEAPIMGGTTCDQKIKRHDNPKDFTPGISDRCERHKTGVSAAGRVFSS